jgi:hypothetical protein
MFARDCFKALGLICVVLPFVGCSSTTIDAITVTPTTTDFQGTGGHVQLTAIATVNHGAHPATYENVTDQVSWSTPLASVVSISTSGYVTIVGTGLTQVTGTMSGYGGPISGSATVCADNPSTSGTSTGFTCPSVSSSDRPAMKISLIQASRESAAPGETRQFEAVRTAANGEQENLTDTIKWTSSDDKVATVNESGVVTAVGRGTATIIASMTNADRTVVAVAANFKVED